MKAYDRYVLPHLINLACGAKEVSHQRQKVVPLAQGRVLEIGMGSGLNIPFYNPTQVEFVWGLEPSSAMRQKAHKRVSKAPFEVHWLDLPGEEIPLDSNSVDTVVLTYTLCTIPDWHSALQQMRRVLKPGGKLVFCEHGQAPDKRTRQWQDRINPLWRTMAGGCNLHRPVPKLLTEGGFEVEQMEAAYIPRTPKIAGFNYWGICHTK